MDKKYITKSAKQTKKLGESLALRLCSGQANEITRKFATVLALSGNLGGGKTTFLQGFAKGLGVKDKILSPTFVVMKHFKTSNYKLKTRNSVGFYHFDCYRLKDEKDIIGLGWKEIFSNPENIVAIEWPEKIKKALPKDIIKINFKFIDKNTREVRLTYVNLTV